MAEKSNGQILIERITQWLSGYMAFTDQGHALVLAVWAVHTWVFDRFDATPYLAVTAATKQAGKTRLMELLRMITQNGRMFGDMTPAAMFRLIDAHEQKLTIYFDEAEKLSSGAAGVMRSVMNTGYRRGQTVTRAKAGGGVDEFPVYCPKCFALIGDVNDTLRDRSIVITLQRGTPTREFDYTTAEGEAALIKATLLATSFHAVAAPQAWLSGRDKEIWSSMFGVAEALKLNRGMVDALTRVAADMVAAKTAPARRYDDAANDEDDAINSQYAERALRDLIAVLPAPSKTHTGDIHTVAAIDAMMALPSAPWRTFRGVGLNGIMLAGLVSRFGVQTNKEVRMLRGRGNKVGKGYSRVNLLASMPGTDKAED